METFALVYRALCVSTAWSKFRPVWMRRTQFATPVRTSFRTMRASMALVSITKARSHTATGHVIQGIRKTLLGFAWAVTTLFLFLPNSPAKSLLMEIVNGTVMMDTVRKVSNANALPSPISMALIACPASSAQSVLIRVKYARNQGIWQETQAASCVPINCQSAPNEYGNAIGSVRTDFSTTIQAVINVRSVPQELIKHTPV